MNNNIVMNEFETYCLKERRKQLDLNMPFLRVFGVRLAIFFPKVILGFDVVKFDKWLAPKKNQSIRDAVLERYGQEGVDILNKLVQ